MKDEERKNLHESSQMEGVKDQYFSFIIFFKGL